ncbi:MAG: hypothetical protein JW829_17380 [Pirellulales bacterium]|nr:hypothetical protein [Pirellulales bacterium]
MTRQVPQGRRRKQGQGLQAVADGKSGASPYLTIANPPRKQPRQLFLAALLWVLCILGLLYVIIS